MTRILITGGSGFIGTNLVEYYARLGHEILNIDKESPQNPNHLQYWKPCNILDLPKLKNDISEFDPKYIFHLAARTDLDGRTLDEYQDNTVGVENLIEAIKCLNDLNGVIFFSSRLVCKIGYVPINSDDYRPSTFYGESKMIGEQIVKSSKTIPCPWDIVRPTSIWGPWFDIPYKNFFTAVINKRYFHPKGKNVFKSFGYVGNTVYELDRIMFRKELERGQTFYLGDYPPLELKQFADLISIEYGGTGVPEIPLVILRFAAFLGDLIKYIGYKKVPLTSFRLDNIVTDMTYDLKPLQNIVGNLPFTMTEGVRTTLTWMNNSSA